MCGILLQLIKGDSLWLAHVCSPTPRTSAVLSMDRWRKTCVASQRDKIKVSDFIRSALDTAISADITDQLKERLGDAR